MGYRSGGRAGFQDGRFPLSGPSAVSQAVVVNNIVSLSDGDIQKIAKSVKEGTEAGAATGLQKASKDSQRRAKLERKTGF